MLQSDISDNLIELLLELGVNQEFAFILKGAILLLAIAGISMLANYITQRLIVSVLASIIAKSKNKYDDIFLERKVFNNLSHIVPALIIYFTIHHALPQYPGIVAFIQDATYIYMIVIVVLVINSFLNALHDIYQKLPISQEVHIKGYIQVVKIIIYFIAAILLFSILFNKSPVALFTGLGAVAAVLLLIFRDTILGFVASIQLSAYSMAKPGDWISMPGFSADGTVIDISISAVKVQNWDKTITSIPTYSMVSNAFVNWKGMELSGGRRIKRHLLFDVQSIYFLTSQQVDGLVQIPYLQAFFAERDAQALKNNDDPHALKTNLTLFREYINWYIKNHPDLHTTMLNVVRQLQATEHGIPVEIIVFSKQQAFADYERVQADVFDHLLALAPVFSLRIYQQPTGTDFERIALHRSKQ